MTRWVRVTACDNIPVREGRAVFLGGREIAIFNLGDRFLATGNRCPHQGGPLCDGIVTGTSVVCPLHTWKTNLATGTVERPAAAKDLCVPTYPTRVEDGVILVGLPPGSAGPLRGTRPRDSGLADRDQGRAGSAGADPPSTRHAA